MSTRILTSESVSEGHPDKVADQISDAVLDAIIAQDANARVACETLVKTGMVMVAGEISTHAWADIESVTRKVIHDIGYNDPSFGFDAESCAVLTSIGKQSPDIAQGVDLNDHEIGAGDQGTVVGYACDETEHFMPAPIAFAHQLMQRSAKLRKNGTLTWLRPDAKAQVSLVYQDSKPIAVDSIVLSTQHSPEIAQNDLIEAVIEDIIKPILPNEWLSDTHYFINPTGRFVIGGPMGDSGLTGRKLMVDTYGNTVRHGGGAFSGKDPSKIDRSAAYVARYLAKNIVAAGLAKKCEVQLSYAIGVVQPTAIDIEIDNVDKANNEELITWIRENIDLSPCGIIKQLQLERPIFQKTAAYGHFGRNEAEFTWEQLDLVDDLKRDFL